MLEDYSPSHLVQGHTGLPQEVLIKTFSWKKMLPCRKTQQMDGEPASAAINRQTGCSVSQHGRWRQDKLLHEATGGLQLPGTPLLPFTQRL